MLCSSETKSALLFFKIEIKNTGFDDLRINLRETVVTAVMIINLIYLAQVDTTYILTVLYIVFKVFKVFYVAWSYQLSDVDCDWVGCAA